jgi:hypothetical protein
MHLSQTHRSITSLTPREICNAIYYHMTSKIQTRHNDDGSILETIEEQIQEFEEQIGFAGKTRTQTAMDLLRQNMIERGLDPDAMPDVELRQEWFKDDDFGENFAAYRQKVAPTDKTEVEDAGLDIEF